MFLGRRSTLMFWVCFAWFGGLRNNKTCPLTCLFQMPIRKSRTRPKAERWGLSTITWVSVIFSGLMKLIASSVKWATDRRPSESRAVKTQSQQTCARLCSRVTHSENLYVYLCPFIYTYSDTHTHSWVHVKVNQYELSRLKKYIGEAESMKINSLLSKDLSFKRITTQHN